MTDAEKIQKFEEIQAKAWGVILGTIPATLLTQMAVARMVRELGIPGPDGQSPESA